MNLKHSQWQVLANKNRRPLKLVQLTILAGLHLKAHEVKVLQIGRTFCP